MQAGSVAALGSVLARSRSTASILQGISILDLAEMSRNFATPPGSVKSSCYWWWFNGLVDKEGITRDLEEFHVKGIGEVLLVNSAGGLGGVPFPQGAPLFSEEWKELYRHAMSEAKRLDVAVGINLCSGWCMGGPWIKREDSGRWYLQSELEVEGPQPFSGQLPLPGNRTGYDKVFNPPGYKEYIDLPLEELDYRDTAVVAIRGGNRITGKRAATLDAKTNHRDASNFIMAVDVMKPLLEQWHDEPGDDPVRPQDVVDLTGKMDSNGHLDWQVPAGKWKIIRTGHRMTGSRLSIAQQEGDGLSVDWFNRRGVELQFEHLGKMFIEEAAKVGNKPKYFCDDSFEDGFPNWTDNILEQFKKYRGYDATPYLPALSGYIIGSAAISDRFLNDYRKTLGDCMADEHYRRFAEMCHQYGMLVQNEASGPSRSGTMCMAVEDSGLLDYPRCDEDLRKLSAELWGPTDRKSTVRHRYGSGTICNFISIRETLAEKNIRPDFEYTGGEDVWLDFIHRTTPEADIYFITNRHGRAVRSDCSFRINDSTPQLWNPVNGKRRAQINYRLAGNYLIVPLKFEAFQSWFVVFPKNTRLMPADVARRTGAPITPDALDNFPELQIVQELTREWDVAFDTHWGGPAQVRFDQLRDWSQSDDLQIRYYSGKAIYTRKFDYMAAIGGPVYLDLGVVKNIARVSLNDTDLGIVWTAPWEVDLTPALKSGSNKLKIEVINLWPNRLIGDAGLPPEKRLTNTNIPFKKDAPLVPSGLLGPVTLRQRK